VADAGLNTGVRKLLPDVELVVRRRDDTWGHQEGHLRALECLDEILPVVKRERHFDKLCPLSRQPNCLGGTGTTRKGTHSVPPASR
jgi:hypothetical protein